jgi:hypothetical protein
MAPRANWKAAIRPEIARRWTHLMSIDTVAFDGRQIGAK